MAASPSAAPSGASSQGTAQGKGLNKKIGPFKAWVWLALVVGGVAGILIVRRLQGQGGGGGGSAGASIPDNALSDLQNAIQQEGQATQQVQANLSNVTSGILGGLTAQQQSYAEIAQQLEASNISLSTQVQDLEQGIQLTPDQIKQIEADALKQAQSLYPIPTAAQTTAATGLTSQH